MTRKNPESITNTRITFDRPTLALPITIQYDSKIMPSGLFETILIDLLGGKGAGLLFMKKMGLPVPQAFVLTTHSWKLTKENQYHLTNDVCKQENLHLNWLEKDTGKKLGDRENPLLVSVRSGAPVSMPGAMKTYLNIGLNDQTVAGLASIVGEEEAYRSYYNLIKEYAIDVFNINKDQFVDINKKNITEEKLQELIIQAQEMIKQQGFDFPQDPKKQIKALTECVFHSWENEESVSHRHQFNIPNDLGTACTVQEMVFGNVENGGSGVMTTYDVDTFDPEPIFGFSQKAQGLAVVGDEVHKTFHLNDFPPPIQEQFQHIVETLKTHEMSRWRILPAEVEFTIDKNGKVYCLQVRNAELSLLACFRVLQQNVSKKNLTELEAIRMLPSSLLKNLLTPPLDQKEVEKAITDDRLFATGQGVVYGNASAILASLDEIKKNPDQSFILTGRIERKDVINLPSNIVGVAIENAGFGSHMTLLLKKICSQRGIPAIIGTSFDAVQYFGKLATVEGSTGQVFVGQIPQAEEIIKSLLSPEELLVINKYIKEREKNPWFWSTDQLERSLEYFHKAQEVKETLNQYKSHKARETAAASQLLPEGSFMPYEIFQPDDIKGIKERLKIIIEKGKDASIRTGHDPFLPKGGPWAAVTNKADIERLFIDPDYSKYGQYSDMISPTTTNSTTHQVTEVLVGEIPKDKLNPAFQDEHIVFTCSANEDGETIIQMKPHTPHLRDLDDKLTTDQLCTLVIKPPRLGEDRPSTEITIGSEIKRDDKGLLLIDHVLSTLLTAFVENDLRMRLAALTELFPPPKYSPVVLEGQARICFSQAKPDMKIEEIPGWVSIYGIKADPISNG